MAASLHKLVRLEQAGDENVIQAAVGTFLARLPEESREALTAALTLLVVNSFRRLGIPVSEHFDLRQELPMLVENLERWRTEAQEKGRMEGLEEGEARGRMENSREIAQQLLRMEGFTPEAVARITSLDLEEVQRLAGQAQ